MAKPTLVFLAAFALSLVLASASFHATITINEEESENQRGQSCQQQMQQAQMLRQCQMYMQEQQRRGYGGGRNNQEQHLRMCCDQLRRMDTQCRCPAIRRMMEQGMGSEPEMMEMAESMPSMCRLQPMRCQFRFAAESAMA